jgi:hypothetical protein
VSLPAIGSSRFGTFAARAMAPAAERLSRMRALRARMTTRWLYTTGLCLAACLFAQSAACSSQQLPGPAGVRRAPWPPGTEDLPADPDLRFGQLDNGLRYAWQHWPKPAGHCSLTQAAWERGRGKR